MQLPLYNSDSANESFKIAIVIVVTDEQHANSPFRAGELLLHVLAQWCLPPKKGFVIEAMMYERHVLPCPLPQVTRKGCAGSDRAIRNVHRPLRKCAFDFCVNPQAIVATIPHVAKKV